jgi:hypothetical protein
MVSEPWAESEVGFGVASGGKLQFGLLEEALQLANDLRLRPHHTLRTDIEHGRQSSDPRTS